MRTRLITILGTIFGLGLLLAMAAPAGAEEGADVYGEEPEEVCESGVGGESTAVDPDCNEVKGETVTRTPTQPAVVESAASTLPVTGGDVVGLAVIGAGAIALGTGFVAYRRRHAA